MILVFPSQYYGYRLAYSYDQFSHGCKVFKLRPSLFYKKILLLTVISPVPLCSIWLFVYKASWASIFLFIWTYIKIFYCVQWENVYVRPDVLLLMQWGWQTVTWKVTVKICMPRDVTVRHCHQDADNIMCTGKSVEPQKLSVIVDGDGPGGEGSLVSPHPVIWQHCSLIFIHMNCSWIHGCQSMETTLMAWCSCSTLLLW